MSKTYWRCPDCGRITEGFGLSCRTGQAPEHVAVVPVDDHAALRAREMDWERYNALDTEVVALRALKARVEDDELLDDVVARGMQGNGHPTNCVCHTFAEDGARERGAADYRAALRWEKGGGA